MQDIIKFYAPDIWLWQYFTSEWRSSLVVNLKWNPVLKFRVSLGSITTVRGHNYGSAITDNYGSYNYGNLI